jgi:hypothetical protein
MTRSAESRPGEQVYSLERRRLLGFLTSRSVGPLFLCSLDYRVRSRRDSIRRRPAILLAGTAGAAAVEVASG